MVLAGCGGTVTARESIAFSQGKVDLVVRSVGGALGEERYDLSFDNRGDRRTFFSGANFSEFNVSERNGRLVIQLCKGFIDHAEPFLVGDVERRFELVRLDIDWNCREKSR